MEARLPPFSPITFIIIILNSFSSRFPVSSSFVWLGEHFSCSFTCWVFLCLFILFRLLCLEWPFCVLVVCCSFLLWRFLPVGGVGRLTCQSFLVRETHRCSGAWSWISSLWSALKCPGVSFEMSLCVLCYFGQPVC